MKNITKNSRLNIGFFTCHLDNDYSSQVCKGVDLAARELDVNLIIFPGMYMNASYNDPQNAYFDYQYNSIFYYASEHTLDALIVSVGSIGSFISENDMLSFLSKFNIPILTIEIEVPGYPYLYTEGRTGMRQAVEHLIKEHNKSKIGFVSGRMENADAKERFDTYCQVLEDNNIPVDSNRIVYGDFSEFTEDIVEELLDNNPDLEAIVFANDQMAVGGYKAIKNRNLVIGKDILVTGYDNTQVSLVLNPLLTTVHNKIIDMGYQSVYEVLNLVNMGKTYINTLNSSLIVRASCGCDHLHAHSPSQKPTKLLFSATVDEAIQKANKLLFADHVNSFFYSDLISWFEPLLTNIFTPIIEFKDYNFQVDVIVNYVNNLLDNNFMNYYSTDSIAYNLLELNKLILGELEDFAHTKAVLILFNNILSSITFKTSYTLFNTIKANRTDMWSSVYITRDTLIYGGDEEACFISIMDKLRETGFRSSYIYIYEEPVVLMPDGSWQIPNMLYLQSYFNNKSTAYLTGDNRLISSHDIFENDYTPNDRRHTFVIIPLFTNNIQHGLFVVEANISNFSKIYSTSLQLSTSLKFISLMQQQLSIQNKLAISAAELNKKNSLLNKLSSTDVLTGINNRRGFLDALKASVNSLANAGKEAMLLFADMDNLKKVNDNYGHNEGDFAIKNIARILEQSFSSSDIIGRIGGDEFVAFALIDDPHLPDVIKCTIERLFKNLNDTCGKPYYIDISIGLITFTCEPNTNFEDILHAADSVLYESKKNKRCDVVKPQG